MRYDNDQQTTYGLGPSKGGLVQGRYININVAALLVATGCMPTTVTPAANDSGDTSLPPVCEMAPEHWLIQAGGSNSDYATDIAAFADGSFVLTGRFSGSITFGMDEDNETIVNTSSEGRFMFLAKYDPHGTFVWATTAVGEGTAVVALDDGSAVVSGGFCPLSEPFPCYATFGLGEMNETTLEATGNDNAFLARYNPDGTLAWAAAVTGRWGIWAHDIVELVDGGIVITGKFHGEATFGVGEAGQTTITSGGFAGKDSVFLARWEQNGSFSWARQTGDDGYARGRALAALPDGSVIVGGGFCLSFNYLAPCSVTFWPGKPSEVTLDGVGGEDLFYARVSAEGELLWIRRAGGPFSERVDVMTSTSAETVVMAGAFCEWNEIPNCTATFGYGPNAETFLGQGGSEVFIAGISTHDGRFQWVTRAGGDVIDEFDTAEGISVGPSGEVFISGSFAGTTATFGDGAAQKSVIVTGATLSSNYTVKLFGDGIPVWVRSFGEACSTVTNSALCDGSVLLAGSFADTLTIPEIEGSVGSTGALDVMIVRIPSSFE